MIQKRGVKTEEMYKTFKRGVGLGLIAPKNEASKIKSIFKKHKIKSQEIGKITNKKGVFINSKKIA